MQLGQEVLSISRVVDALPPWMEEKAATKALFEHIASKQLTAFVRVPVQSIVVEQPRLFIQPVETFGDAAGGGVPIVTMMDRRAKAHGVDLIERPVAKPLVRFLELDAADLQTLATSGRVRRHWFKARALEARGDGWQIEPRTLRCILPAQHTEADDNHVAQKLRAAISYDPTLEHSFSVADVYLRSSDVVELKHVRFKPEDEDPHRLFEAAPAVFGVYSAARRYALELGAIPRTQARQDRERLEETRQKVISHLSSFGKPLALSSIQKQALKFIDPKFAWGSGAEHKSFAEAASAIADFHQKYAYENFVGDGLGLILYVAKRALALQFDAQQGKPGALAPSMSSLRAQLEALNFTGQAEIEAIAAIIRWRGPKAKRKTPTEKKLKMESRRAKKR